MKINAAEFYKSFFKCADLPAPGLPEIAFAGRSNVGKSSLINKLLNRRGIAKTSSTPGRTQSINFILANQAFFLVDLPGYGYAKVPLEVKRHWGKLIQDYLQQRAGLKLLVLIVDARRTGTDDEKLFVQWLDQNAIAWVLVITKTDKLKNAQLARSLRHWREFLETDSIIEFSAVSGKGRDKVWRVIEAAMQAASDKNA
ncbi:MAG: YihA family ribosome biogenesis GTP-binding protein [Deltaproteobacteria bacterium]|nr:YihA family ribosome biogenesis GTP-binding protein [Deltaproteobacteria bacterium]